MKTKVLIAGLLLTAMAPATYAQRCDCSSNGWTGACRATVFRDGEGVRLTSTSSHCSRVDWYLGDTPQVSVFWGAKEWVPIGLTDRSSGLSITECRVCEDKLSKDAAARTPRQVFNTPTPSSTLAQCDRFTEQLVQIGTSANLANADQSHQALVRLCGGDMAACMRKLEQCGK